MARILALDIGKKRTGIAVTDPMKIIATALNVVATQKLELFLDEYLKLEEVEKFVVGYPLNLDNSPTDATAIVEKWIKKMTAKFPGIPIIKEDERYTSKMARKTLVEAGYKKKDREIKGNTDKISAVLILQSYMEYHN